MDKQRNKTRQKKQTRDKTLAAHMVAGQRALHETKKIRQDKKKTNMR
jgi:hypothetical protein